MKLRSWLDSEGFQSGKVQQTVEGAAQAGKVQLQMKMQKYETSNVFLSRMWVDCLAPFDSWIFCLSLGMSLVLSGCL